MIVITVRGHAGANCCYRVVAKFVNEKYCTLAMARFSDPK